MHSTNLLIWLLLIIAYWIVSATSNKCPIGYDCIDIRKCDRFAPHLNRLDSWSKSLKRELKTLHCSSTEEVFMKIYKVCCARVEKIRTELLNLQICGTILSKQIVYGNETKLYQNPWMALLYYQEGWRCAGTLINERYILTAAHCVKNVKLNFVRLGEFDLSLRIDCDQWGWGCAPAPQDIPIDRVIIHKKYNSRRKQNDIALLRLAHPVTLNKNVMPICLPVTPQLRENEQWYKVFGWGRTEKDMSGKLRGAEVNLLLQDACNKWIAQVDKYIRNTNTQVCAIGAANMSEHCRGDSGGPLLTRTSTGRYVQYGVVSYGLYSCGKEPFPETYTRVASFIDWIFDNLEE